MPPSIENPKITVITVCFNAVNSIEETMLSVLNQTYDNIEYIIIDGGSTDGTVDKIKKYSNRLSFWISEPDQGIYDAMNKSFKWASGDYLLFLNAGDTFYNNVVIDNITKACNGSQIIYGDVMMHFTDNHSAIYNGKFNKFKLTFRNICHQSIFYPQMVYKNFQFDLNYKFLADWVSNMQLWKTNSFKYVPIIIANYYRGGVSDSNKDYYFEKNYEILIKWNLGICAWLYIFFRRYYFRIISIINRFLLLNNRQ
ncbi:MAG: glycosyltransferase [Bacilli bacterium]|nr:glycosyltransferase [Bacilli bacterium]